jgi:CHRD domain
MTGESVTINEMRKAIVLCVVTAAVGVPSVYAASSATGFASAMDAHHVVTPQNKPWTPPKAVAKAKGTFSATLGGGKDRTLKWKITYIGVGSSPLKIADVHYGKAGKFGPILFRLCGPCKSGQTGSKSITLAAIGSLKAGTAWVTVITGTYPNGVIRGQIRVS